jgi:hypothetical protein
MKMDEAKVAKFLKDNGLTEEEYEISPVSMYEEYNYYKDMNIEVEKKYNLTQQVTITSNDIEKVQKLSKKTEDLINMDVLYQSNNPEYYYTKLPDTRINLLPEAVADAQKELKQSPKVLLVKLILWKVLIWELSKLENQIQLMLLNTECMILLLSKKK